MNVQGGNHGSFADRRGAIITAKPKAGSEAEFTTRRTDARNLGIFSENDASEFSPARALRDLEATGFTPKQALEELLYGDDKRMSPDYLEPYRDAPRDKLAAQELGDQIYRATLNDVPLYTVS